MKMFQWIGQSRLRIALAMLFFCGLLVLSLPALFLSVLAGGSNGGAGALEPLLALIGVLVSIIGTVSTVILAWRTDRLTATESELKVLQMQHQIDELQRRLNADASV